MPLPPPLIGGAAYQLMAKPRAKDYLGEIASKTVFNV